MPCPEKIESRGEATASIQLFQLWYNRRLRRAIKRMDCISRIYEFVHMRNQYKPHCVYTSTDCNTLGDRAIIGDFDFAHPSHWFMIIPKRQSAIISRFYAVKLFCQSTSSIHLIHTSSGDRKNEFFLTRVDRDKS